MEGGVSDGIVELYDVLNDRSLRATNTVPLPAMAAPGTEGLASRVGVLPAELLLTDVGQVFLSATLHSGSLKLKVSAGPDIELTVSANQADAFVAAFSASGDALWAKPLLADDWIARPVFPNSLAYDSNAGLLAFCATIASPFGLLPESSTRAGNAAIVVGLDASTGSYRWDAAVIAGALDA